MKWAELEPSPDMVAALDAAGERPFDGTRADKNNWSNRFADACAVMVAKSVARHPVWSKFEVRPNPDGSGRESLTFVAGGDQKRVDVIASTLATGLQLGVSLKGMNFRDATSGNFDKNLTGRTYELQAEVSAIHGYQPQAFLVGLFFLPLASTQDKKSGASSFARAVAHLRARTGRLDPTLPSQLARCDAAAIALYVPGDPEDEAQRGAVRFLDVHDAPPHRGRPRVETTLTLGKVVDRWAVQRYEAAGKSIDYVAPEDD
ncbi:hypothetical protein [Egicoccus sp. AB-alg2]|uniref:hypothetical protein n=1 Tax=Egicoccus sp. AB-alg2 TaxID=3242693 RepID=UPI00359DA771